MTLLTRAREAIAEIRGPDQPSRLVQIKAEDLTLAGTFHGSTFWRHPRHGALVEGETLLDDGAPLPDIGAYIEILPDEPGGLRTFRVFSWSSERVLERIGRKPERHERPLRAVDRASRGGAFRQGREVLIPPASDPPEPGHVSYLAGTRRLVAGGDPAAALVRSRRGAARTARERFDRLVGEGLRFAPLNDGSGRFVAFAPEGRPKPYVVADLEDVADQIRPLVHGEPEPRCERCGITNASMVSVPDAVLLCGLCASEPWT